MDMTENEKWAYLGGIIDGEGNIRIDLAKNPRRFMQYTGRLTVANTDIRMINWLKDNFQGYIWTRKRDDDFARSRGWKDCYHWIKILNSPSREFIEKVMPFLITKKDRMQILLEFLDTKSTAGIPITEETRKKRLELIDRMNHLNKRGI